MRCVFFVSSCTNGVIILIFFRVIVDIIIYVKKTHYEFFVKFCIARVDLLLDALAYENNDENL